jgi:hypothetical protein
MGLVGRSLWQERDILVNKIYDLYYKYENIDDVIYAHWNM